MRLAEYWGIGPKTSALLEETIGVEAAIQAIETGDLEHLVSAGLTTGRATRILRHARGGEAMGLLGTADVRTVYKQVLDTAAAFAVTDAAADRIRLLTPLSSVEAMNDRLDDVLAAREDWTARSERQQQAALDAFETYDESGGGDRAAVVAARDLLAADLTEGLFDPLGPLDAATLAAAARALGGLQSGSEVAPGTDDELDDLRDKLATVEDLAATPDDVLTAVEAEARTTEDVREGLVRHVTDETGVEAARVREAMPVEAIDVSQFVDDALRSLAESIRASVAEREAAVAEDLEATLADHAEAVDLAVDAVEDIALSLSLARFAIDFDLSRPTISEERTLGVVAARNLFLDESVVQPVTYGIGDHSLVVPGANSPPSGDRVAVLTGANSGGKTTLLETLCQVQLLAQMGLPVPAASAEVGVVDTIVFHRRHASFNAGVLESTLRTVVPPVVERDRTLMLVDEFEAITEPGRAADLLHGLVSLTVEADALGVFVTHLAEDLEPLPAEGRVDGIFAEGLTPSLDLSVDYQPRFETVGRSTPEFIVSRLVANASDRAERAGYERLAEAVGERAVQRTLSDARWSE